MPELALQPLQLLAHLDAQERIERRQRLVQQEDPRLHDQGARQGDALLLPARKLRRQPRRIVRHLHEVEKFARAPMPLGLGDAAHLQAECDVVQAVQMREQRVALKHHRRAALARRQAGDD